METYRVVLVRNPESDEAGVNFEASLGKTSLELNILWERFWMFG